jgi:hypothetical protein
MASKLKRGNTEILNVFARAQTINIELHLVVNVHPDKVHPRPPLCNLSARSQDAVKSHTAV